MKNINTFWFRLRHKLNGTTIDKTAWIGKGVNIAPNCYIGPFCIIGANAEHKKKWGVNKGVLICKDSILTGHVTVDGGVNVKTIIGEDCFIMKGVHIGHDAHLLGNIILACHSLIGGHVVISRQCNVGLGAAIHQRVVIPEGCMIGMNSVVTKKTKLWKFGVFAGSPAKHIRMNSHKTKMTLEQYHKMIEDES